MAVPLRLTALCGARADGAPLAHLLEIGPPDAQLTVLLDCGWGGIASGGGGGSASSGGGADGDADLAALLAALPRADAVLLSHPGPRHCGALAAAARRGLLGAPVFGTAPIAKMGAMFAYDTYLSAQATQEFDLYDLDDVDRAFALITKLKYTQRAPLPGPRAAALAERLGCGGVWVTPFAAGHMLGGAVWRVEVGGEEVVYAVDTNHRKERHLNGGDLESVSSRPALLIAGAAAARAAPAERARRDAALLEPLMAALRGGGSVLLPCDTAGRVLELLLLLDDHWGENNLRDTYPLVFLSTVGPSTFDFAQASLEWMADGVTRAFEAGRGNPLKLRNVRLVSSMAELQASTVWRASRPLVVLASGPDMGPGTLSRQVLLQWAKDPKALILFTQRPRPGSLAATIAGRGGSGALVIPSLPVWRRAPLEGAELEAWEAARAADAAAAGAAAAAAEADAAAAAAGGRLALRSSSAALSQLVRGAGGELVQVLPGALSAAGDGGGGFDAAAGVTGGGTSDAPAGDTLMEGFEPPAGAAAPMFPDEDEALAATWDVYGELVDPEAWAKAAGAGAAPEEDGGADDAAEEEARPTKVVRDDVTLTVAARHVSVDLEGLSDGRSLRAFVSMAAPRQLAVVGAGAADADEMAAGWREDLARFGTRVVAPGPGEAVPLSLAANYPVSLDPSLLSASTLHQLGQYQLVWLDARLEDAGTGGGGKGGAAAGAPGAAGQQQEGGSGDQEMAEAGQQQQKQQQQQQQGEGEKEKEKEEGAAEGQEQQRQQTAAPPAPRLRLVPAGGADGDITGTGDDISDHGGDYAGHGGIFIGDVKLSEVKQALARAGISSAFRGGKLLCAGAVVVGAARGGGGSGEGVLEIEGPLSEEYFRIRDVVYSQYQVC